MLSHALKRYYEPLRLPIQSLAISVSLIHLGWHSSRAAASGLQHWVEYLPQHAIPSTPEDCKGRFRYQNPAQRPSPHDHRVGIFNQIYEATSRFTFVTACCFANWELTTLCHQNAAPLNYRGERITPRTGLQPVRHSAVTANGQVLRFAFLPFQTGLTVIAGSRAISQNTGIVLYFPIFHAQRTILQLAVDHPVLVW